MIISFGQQPVNHVFVNWTINEQLPDWLEEANFRVVAVSTDDSRSTAKARALAEGHGWDDFIMLYDKNQEFMRAMNVSLTPQVYVVDADGKIVYSHTGYAPGSELELLKAIKTTEIETVIIHR